MLTPGHFEYSSFISLSKSLKWLRDLHAAIVTVGNSIPKTMITINPPLSTTALTKKIPIFAALFRGPSLFQNLMEKELK